MAVTLAFFLLIDGFLFYRYQQQLEGYNITRTIIDAESVAAEEPMASLEQELDISEEPPAPVKGQEPATEEESAVPQDAAPLPEEEEGVADAVRVVVGVSGASSHLRVQEDRQIIFDQVSEPSFSRKFVADRAIGIQTGNAGAVWVEVDGRDQGPLGAAGEVTTRTYTTPKGMEASE